MDLTAEHYLIGAILGIHALGMLYGYWRAPITAKSNWLVGTVTGLVLLAVYGIVQAPDEGQGSGAAWFLIFCVATGGAVAFATLFSSYHFGRFIKTLT